MSGTTIPYQLRQNKIIDRHAFIQLLLRINRIISLSEYTYVGFGGHSLEDFKYVHNQLELKEMISIEENENVYKRQEFNKPLKCIELFQGDSKDFLNARLGLVSKLIIWLDYTTPNKLASQLAEFQDCLNDRGHGDIVKITLNANPANIEVAEKKQLHEYRFEEFKVRLGDLFPAGQSDPKMMTTRNYPQLLIEVLKYCSNQILGGSKGARIFQPLTAFTYADGQQMLTLTGILLDREEKEDFLKRSEIESWDLSNTDWENPRKINIPDFTLRERLYVDALLPGTSVSEIHEKLNFYFDAKEKVSEEMLENYILFYRKSPVFSRIVL